MKLLRIGPSGAERPAVLGEDGRARDIGGIVADIDAGDLVSPEVTGAIAAALRDDTLPVVGQDDRIGPPLPRIGKIVCIGLNYRDHAAEMPAAVPDEPVIFMKAPDTVVGPYDNVPVPRASTRTDWEVELAVVIGRRARYLDSADEARDVIAGYAVSHDVSEREYQLDRGGQWDKGKNCEAFNPLGPYLVTADEVPDPQNLPMRLWVNGEKRQDSSTAEMIFGVDYLIHYLSQFMVLYPGDVINTGTPAGVALGTGVPYLKPGDVVELEIEGLGRSRQTFVSYKELP